MLRATTDIYTMQSAISFIKLSLILYKTRNCVYPVEWKLKLVYEVCFI